MGSKHLVFAALGLAAVAVFANPSTDSGRQKIFESAARQAEAQSMAIDEVESGRLDRLTSAAAARAVVAMRCESWRFESVSKAVQQMLEAKIAMGSPDLPRSMAYAKDSARMKYKAMLQANAQLGCEELGRLRDIAYDQGFLE